MHCVCVLVAQSCLCDPTDCSPPGFSVHGIPQERILEGVGIPFSRGSSQPRDWTCILHTEGRFFTIWATREPCIRGEQTTLHTFSHLVLRMRMEALRSYSHCYYVYLMTEPSVLRGIPRCSWPELWISYPEPFPQSILSTWTFFFSIDKTLDHCYSWSLWLAYIPDYILSSSWNSNVLVCFRRLSF